MNCKLTVRHFISALFSVAFLAACQNAPDQLEEGSSAEGAAALSQILPGTWENVSMKVNVYSANNVADSSYVFQINDGDWENLFTVLPPRTYFETDNKYRIEYRDRRDSIISTSRGVWNVMGDTLMMIEKDQTMQGKIKYDKGLLYFIGLRDWDEDGQEDDAYLEVKRRVSIGTEK